MNVKEPFGIVTGCHAGDKFMVGATLASIRHYCPNVPICLTVDGDFDVSDLEAEYDLIILRVSEMEDQEIARFIGGSFHAKHAAMWEGPFEFYVWLDCDAIIWGDFTDQIRTDLDFQIFWPEISIPADASDVPSWVAHFYFDVEKLKQFDPEFDWRGHPYFCAGVFACRRNVIPFEKYRDTEILGRANPCLFAWGDMGMLNYLILEKSQRGEIAMDWIDLQWSRNFGFDKLKQDDPVTGWDFPVDVKYPVILHFCGRKPHIFDFKCYSKPFTIARLAHHRRSHSNLGAWLAIFREDGRVLFGKIVGKVKRSLGWK